MTEVTTIGIDLAKRFFHMVGMDTAGALVWRKKVTRDQLEATVMGLPRCELAMEACTGAHEWARRFAKLGFKVRLVSAAEVGRRVGKRRKNDWRDALGIVAVARDPLIKAIAIKSKENQAAQIEVRVRARRIGERTAIINQMRGVLAEYGIVLPKGAGAFKRRFLELQSQAESKLAGVPAEVIHLLSESCSELIAREAAITACDRRIAALCAALPEAQRLLTIPGIGPINSVAFAAAVPQPELFDRARSLSAWLGIVPSQHSSGGKERLGKITKHGNPVLRSLLTHAARSVLVQVRRQKHKPADALGSFAWRKAARTSWNKAVIAVANKLARIIWCVLARNEIYRPITPKADVKAA